MFFHCNVWIYDQTSRQWWLLSRGHQGTMTPLSMLSTKYKYDHTDLDWKILFLLSIFCKNDQCKYHIVNEKNV